MADREIRIKVVVDQAGSINRLDRGLRGAQGSASGLVKQFNTLRNAVIGSAVIVSVYRLGTAAVQAASEFESSFAGIRKTVDATEAEFAQLSAEMRDLSKQIPVNVNELNRIGEAAGQLGIATENILSFTRTMADLGVTTNLSSDQAATALARLANITGLPQSQIDRLGSTIVDLGNNFATTESEIVEFGLRMAGAGAIAGLTEAEILGIGAALSSVGLEAEAGGTAVQQALLTIDQAVATGNEDLAVFARTAGVSAEAFRQAWTEDAGSAFTAFIEGLGRQGKAAAVTLDEVGLGGIRTSRAFLSLANAGDVLSRSMDIGTKAFEENTALAAEAEKRYETFESQVQLAKNAVNDLFIDIGRFLTPTVEVLAEQLGVATGELQAFLDTEEGQQAAREIADAVGELTGEFVELATILKDLRPLVSLFFVAIDAELGKLRILAQIVEASTLQLRIAAAALNLFRQEAEKTPDLTPQFAGIGKALDEADAEVARLMAEGLARMRREAEEAGGGLEGSSDAAKEFSNAVSDLRSELLPTVVELEALEAAQDLWRRALDAGKISIRDYIQGADEMAARWEELTNGTKEGAEELKRYQDRLRSLADQGDPLGAELRRAGEDFAFVAAMMQLGIGTAEQWEAAIKGIHDRLREFSVQDLADDVTELNDNTRQASTRELPDLADSFSLVFDAAERVFDTIGEDEWAKAARAILNVVNAVVALQEALKAVEATRAAQQVAEGANAAQGVGQTAQVAQGAGSASASLASFASYVNVAIAAFQAWVAVIEAFTTHMENPDTVFVYNPSSGLNAQLPGYAQEKFGNLENIVDPEEIGAATEALGQFARDFTESLREIQGALGLVIPEDLGNFVVRVTESIEEGRDSIFRVTIDGITRSFESLADATGFAVQEFLQRAVAAGAEVDEAVRQIISNELVDPEQFQENLTRVQELVDQANMALGGLSALEIEMRKLPASLQALRQELEQLGLSADQVERLVGGQLVASMQAWRQQITGEELSVGRRQEIQRAQAELFNAEFDLRIAELEAKKSALLAEAGLTQEEIKLVNASLAAQSAGLSAEGQIAQGEAQLQGKVIDARGRFVGAEASLYNAELGVMKGFVQAGAGIVQTGAAVVGSFADALSALPEEIRKQVEAIQSIINALKKIGKINIGNLKLPGIPDAPSIPSVPSGPTGDPALDAFLETLNELLEPARAAAEQLAALNEEFNEVSRRVEELGSALESLADFRADLLAGPQSPLSPGAQLAEAKSQLQAAAEAAAGGDPEAIRDLQRLSQQYLSIAAGYFGTAGPGYQAAFALVDQLTGDVLEQGNDLLMSELDHLQEIVDQQAQIISAAEAALGQAEAFAAQHAQYAEQANQILGGVHSSIERMNEDLAERLEAIEDAFERYAEAASERNAA